jgi:hypothetical protein
MNFDPDANNVGNFFYEEEVTSYELRVASYRGDFDMQDFRKLIVWQKAHELVLKIYIATKKFPKQEIYGITSQIRRSSTSITANISEGCGRKTKTEFARFLVIA